jgi:hypothetical protein
MVFNFIRSLLPLPLEKAGVRHIYKRMGFFSDQEGIMRRYQRESAYWGDHLTKTKAFILEAASDKGKGKCAILGSGWLLDVPINELAGMFSEVYLFDIQHHVLVQKSLKHLSNITYIDTDLSGFAIQIYNIASNYRKIDDKSIFSAMKPSFNFNLMDFDFVVSCNILNQLDILLLDYLKRKVKLSETAEKFLRTSIQDIHLKLLPKGKSCIITDIEELWVNRRDEIENKACLLYATNFPLKPEDKWIWKFDNHFMYRNTHKIWFRVVANNL